MSIVDLHPEELLDKHAHGMLSGSERARLDAHVATCAVCRFELAARVDFATLSLAPMAAPGERFESEPELVAPLLARAPGRSRRRALVFGLAAALIGGLSFAALSTGLVGQRHAAAIPAVEKRAPHGAAPTAPAERGTAEPPAEPESAAPAVAAANDAPEPPKDRASPGRARPTASAADLFRSANAARREQDMERAIGLYKELESRYPRSEEARVSFATLGRLLLDRGDPRAALQGFDQYLSRGDTALGEEAVVGRALAFERLGASDSESAAWQEVLRRFPGSVHARLARARLLALGAR